MRSMTTTCCALAQFHIPLQIARILREIFFGAKLDGVDEGAGD